MTVTCVKNGRLELILSPSDKIDLSYLEEFQKASRGSNPPKVRVDSIQNPGENPSVTLTIFIDKLSSSPGSSSNE